MGVGQYSANCSVLLSHRSLQFDFIGFMTAFFPSSSTINIATIEAAKAQGMHWLCSSDFVCVLYGIHP